MTPNPRHAIRCREPLAAIRSARRRACRLLFAAALLASPLAPAAAPSQHLALYAAQYSPQRLVDILTEAPRFGSSQLLALAWGRVLSAPERPLRWEFEAQFVQHGGGQSHQEVNALIVARWMRFPWDHVLDTRVAIGDGLSYAARMPALEPRSGAEDERSARLLNYLMLEIEVVPPGQPQWGLFTRIHHRSGVNGTFGNVKGGSNFIGFGARYRF
jgi:hypothetical protein